MNIAVIREIIDSALEEVEETLEKKGNTLPKEEIDLLFDEAKVHIMTLSEHYTDWWKRVDTFDVIDVSNPQTSLYNTVLARIRMAMTSMPMAVAEKAAELLSREWSSEAEVEAMNVSLNAMIKALKDPQYANV